MQVNFPDKQVSDSMSETTSAKPFAQINQLNDVAVAAMFITKAGFMIKAVTATIS